MKKNKSSFYIILFLLLFSPMLHKSYTQSIPATATFFTSGVNSPWSIGIGYDLGFAKVLSLNLQLIGGANSQVNAISTFGDVFFAELQIAPRLYMNKIDTWEGLYLAVPLRVGYYNMPVRSSSSTLVLSRINSAMAGVGIYVGYRWERNLVTDMKDFPFTLVLEPYLGWSLDLFFGGLPANVSPTGFEMANRFSIGITFKISFYTHRKSRETLEAEERAAEEANPDNSENTNETQTAS